MICEFGDVVVVPFPFVDRPIAKRRPALVLSNRDFNDDNAHTVLAMITSAKRSIWPSDIAILDSADTGLTHPSVVRWKVFTVPNELIARRAGRLGATDQRKVAATARKTLGPERA